MIKLKEKNLIFFRLLYVILASLIFFKTAWLSDDSFITLNQVWNFINGDGIVWNSSQRVQAFTHPLWFLLLSIVSFFTKELFLTNLIISFICSITSILILFNLFFKKNSSVPPESLLIVFSIFCSKAFTDYFTSGLENSLSYLLASIFIYLTLNSKYQERLKHHLSFIILACCFLNRFDFALLFLPITFNYFKNSNYSFSQFIKSSWIGATIVLLWLIFSLFYFGSIFPNTFYAKMNHGYPFLSILKKGMLYSLNLIQRDPVTFITIIFGITCGLNSKNSSMKSLAIGIFFYWTYILYSGGGFMQGRFFTLIYFISIFIILYCLENKSSHLISLKYFAPLLIICAYLGPRPILSNSSYNYGKIRKGIADERGVYYQRYGLLSKNRSWPIVNRIDNKEIRLTKIKCGGMGAYGLKNKDSFILIDNCGLTDPFLSRLNVKETNSWRIGHLERVVPQAYLNYLKNLEFNFHDDRISSLHSMISSIVSDPLFETKRLINIARLNLPFIYKYYLKSQGEKTL